MLNKKTLLMLVASYIFFESSPSFAMEQSADDYDPTDRSGRLVRTAQPNLEELRAGLKNQQFLEFPPSLHSSDCQLETFGWRGLGFRVAEEGMKAVTYANTCTGGGKLSFDKQEAGKGIYNCKYTAYRMEYNEKVVLSPFNPGYYALPFDSEVNWALKTLGLQKGAPEVVEKDNSLPLNIHLSACIQKNPDQTNNFVLASHTILLNRKARDQRTAPALMQNEIDKAKEAARKAQVLIDLSEELKVKNQQLTAQLKEIEELRKAAETRAVEAEGRVEEAETREKKTLTLLEKLKLHGIKIPETDLEAIQASKNSLKNIGKLGVANFGSK